MSNIDPDLYRGRLKDELYWWLGTKRPFYINGEYKIELLHLDREHYSAKIRITNLKSGEFVDQEAIDAEQLSRIQS